MPAAQNHLIERLPRRERTRLLRLADAVPLVLGEVLCEADQPARHVWFPVDGFVSLIAPMEGRPALEVAMVGREGMLGAQVILGVAAVRWQALVQGSGSAWRIGRAEFRAELARSAPLRRLLDRYLYVLMAQLAGAAACVRFHEIGPRLARWLLMSQDRAHAERFHLTHELMAYMLGVRRVGITAAAGAMQRRGLIEYRRGELRVVDRAGLEAAACECYANDCAAYAQTIG